MNKKIHKININSLFIHIQALFITLFLYMNAFILDCLSRVVITTKTSFIIDLVLHKFSGTEAVEARLLSTFTREPHLLNGPTDREQIVISVIFLPNPYEGYYLEIFLLKWVCKTFTSLLTWIKLTSVSQAWRSNWEFSQIADNFH